MSLRKFVWRLMPLIAVLALVLSGCGNSNTSVLSPKGPVAQEQLSLIEITFGVMIFVFLVVMAIYLYVLFRFRKRKGDDSIPKQVEGNHVLEIIWTVIPILLLIVIAVPTIHYTFKHSHNYTNDKDPKIMHVKVTGHQFWWEFNYPAEQINTAQDLVIPVGKKVAFQITSADVNHSFWVPSLGGKVDANPGMENVLYLQADQPGVYGGKCAELCGFSHALMDFKVKAVPQAEYDQWVAKMKTPATVPADAAKGEQIFKQNCVACHAVQANGLGAGPNLNGLASRERIAGILERTDQATNDANLKKWIHNPQDVKPGAKMPSFAQLDDSQLNDLVKYLDSLK